MKLKVSALALGVTLAIAGGIGYSVFSSDSANTAQADVAQAVLPEVDVAAPLMQTITQYQTYSGKIEAIESVEIRPLVAGAITEVRFKDGALVKKGDPLFTIDTRLYEAAVASAEGEVASATAQFAYARTDAERAARLLPQKAISQREHDAAQQLARSASANLKSAQAQLRTAKVNLDYCHIVAPVAGRVSRAELTLGNVVSAGATAPVLTRLVSVSPIYAAFEVDERSYLNFMNQARPQAVGVDMALATDSGFSRHGHVDSIDNQLNGASGTIRVRARFENPNGTLVPGMYAQVKVNAGKPRQALMIDDAAVGTDQSRRFVLVVDEGNRVHYRQVKLGALHNGMRIVEEGLSADDRVVVEGGQRIRPDDQVSVKLVTMEKPTTTLSAQR
jgi:membrane fusion protein, multidrug efflux system